MNTKLLSSLVVVGIVCALSVLTVFAIVVRDYKFIVENKAFFLLEIICFALLPSILFVFVAMKTRKLRRADGIIWLLSLSLKLIAFHVLFQLSGLYSSSFRT
jgi:hypothetical protein